MSSWPSASASASTPKSGLVGQHARQHGIAAFRPGPKAGNAKRIVWPTRPRTPI